MPSGSAAPNPPQTDGDLFPVAILNHIQDPVQVLAPDYRLIWCNALKGCDDPAQLVGRRCHEAFFQRHSPCPDCPLSECLATGRPTVRDKFIPLRDGGYRWKQVHSYPVTGRGGRVEMVVKIGFDVTESRREMGRLEKRLLSLESALAGASAAAGDLSSDDGSFGLTPREKEVLTLLAQGLSQPRMARALGLSPHTVKTHVAHIFDKLGVGDRAQAAVWAVRLGLV